jgi:hypothetical protein
MTGGGAPARMRGPAAAAQAEPPDDRGHLRAKQIETDSVHPDDQHVA